MKNIKVPSLLREYRTWVKQGVIQFIKEPKKRDKILKYIEDLLVVMNKEYDSDFEWHEAHERGTRLWQELASLALHDIDSTSKGNSKLFAFLKSATAFEDLLYGLEPYYRDHTLHSLWVYLIGEHILRTHFTDIHDKLNWYLFNDIKKEQSKLLYPDDLVAYSVDVKEASLIGKVQEKRDAIWCMMALCHDLGYSLEKLSKLNEKVKDVLSFFEVPDFRQIGYSLDIEHQYLVSQFLELMAMDVRIVPSEDYWELASLRDTLGDNEEEYKKKLEEKTLVKCYRDDSTYWLLCRALEKKQHGILSSYLIYKILGIFADASVQAPAEKWGLDDDDAVDNLVRGDILYAIAQHEFDFAYLYEFGSLADILIIADELEEFSRHGRELLSRKYYPTVAQSKVDFRKSTINGENNITIEIFYKVEAPRNLIDFFIHKAERLCRIYSFDEGNDKSEFFLIEEICMTAEKGTKKLTFRLNRNPQKTRGIFPRTKRVTNGDAKEGYVLECRDDKIFHISDNGDEIPLIDWFGDLVDQRWKNEADEFLRLKQLEAT